VQLTVRLTAETAQALRRKRPLTQATRQLLRATKQLGLALEPLHPYVPDSPLAAYFTAQVSDPDSAVKAMAGLQKCAAVEAAYLKPAEALPG
jgi:hypothetical protein